MKRVYLILTAIGFIAPNILITKVGVETGNYLLYTHPLDTMQAMFANDIASAFMLDLLVAVLVFFVWSFNEAKRIGMKAPYLVWALTMLFGLSGALPLFLYQREVSIDQNAERES